MTMPPVFTSPAVRWLALLALCGAYLQGGLVKLMDFNGAQAEMAHFGLQPVSYTHLTLPTIYSV